MSAPRPGALLVLDPDDGRGPRYVIVTGERAAPDGYVEYDVIADPTNPPMNGEPCD